MRETDADVDVRATLVVVMLSQMYCPANTMLYGVVGLTCIPKV